MHILGARKRPVYCYDNDTGNFLVQFEGLRIAAKFLNIKDSQSIRYRIDTNKTLVVFYNDKIYSMLFKSNKI